MMPGKIEKARNPRSTLNRLVRYFGHFSGPLLLVFGLIVTYTVLGLVGPYLMGVAIDGYIATKDLTGLARIAVLMLIAFLLNNVFQAIANWVMAGISQRALQQLRGDLFQHLQTLPLRFFDRNPARAN